jgi:hypothetical protein
VEAKITATISIVLSIVGKGRASEVSEARNTIRHYSKTVNLSLVSKSFITVSGINITLEYHHLLVGCSDQMKEHGVPRNIAAVFQSAFQL